MSLVDMFYSLSTGSKRQRLLMTPECQQLPWYGLDVMGTVKKPADLGDWSGVTSIGGAGHFELVTDFSSSNGFGTLANGDLLITDLTITPSDIAEFCIDMYPPEAIVEQARLVLDLSYDTPAALTTWGRIKALYEGN